MHLHKPWCVFLHSVQSSGGPTCTDICSDLCHEVSCVRAKHLPKVCLKALITNSSELVAGHLSLWREGLILNVLIYFLNAGRMALSDRGIKSNLLSAFPFHFADSLLFPAGTNKSSVTKFSGFSNQVYQIRRHFKGYSIHLSGQIDTFPFHCQFTQLLFFSHWNEVLWFKLKMIIRLWEDTVTWDTKTWTT